MATFSLLPTGVTGTNNWSVSTGIDFIDLVDEDDDSTYIFEITINHEINYTFADPLIAEGDIDFNEDVTVSAKAHAHYTETGASVAMSIQTNGTGISLGAAAVSVDDSAFPVYTGLSGTTKSLGSDWDYAALQALQMKLTCTGRPARFNYLRVSFIYFKVDYTAAVAAARDNATFFGTNF